MTRHRLGGQDRFANIASGNVILSAANTITFDEVLTGISLGVGVGIISDADNLSWGWTTTQDPTDLLDAADRRIIHSMGLTSMIVGAVVSLWVHKQPFVHQFFPPMIFAAPRIFLGASSSGAGAAIQLRSRLYFRFIELSAQEYLEIAETFQLTS